MAKDQTTKNVRLDNDVMKTLAKARQGFESPNDCLKRILSQSPCKPKRSSDVTEDAEDTEDIGENQKDE